jgi:mannose-1-phosphate guanylyltransferase
MSTWAIVLAGGDGTRLQGETTRRYGYPRAKQFCDFDGSGTLLDHALERAACITSPFRIHVVISAPWRAEAEQVLLRHPAVWLLTQPRNRGTTPALLLALLAVRRLDPDADVLLMPADHHFENGSAFVGAALQALHRSAFDQAHLHLLGVTPDQPVEGCGWIVPGPSGTVSAFREKPAPDEVAELASAGALVNCFVIAGRAAAFLELFRQCTPGWWRTMLAAAGIEDRIEAAYAVLPASDFSRDVLERAATSLRVVPLPGSGWSDVGTPERLRHVLDAGGFACTTRPTWSVA